jgi:uncharacterized protein YjdB
MEERLGRATIKYSLSLAGKWDLLSQGWKADGETAGNYKNLVATALKIDVDEQMKRSGCFVRYKVLPTNSSEINFGDDYTPWQWNRNGQQAGNNNWELRSVRIKLEGSKIYHVQYRVFEQGSGWLPWQENGGLAGYGNKGKVMGIEVKLVAGAV